MGVSLQTARNLELEFDSDRRPWERGLKEPARAYAAFLVFRNLGPKRSLIEAYRRWRLEELTRMVRPDGVPAAAGLPENLQVPGGWRNWAQEYHWAERALAWDDWNDEQEKEASAQRMEERRKRLSEQRRLLDELEFARIMKMGTLIDDLLDKPLDRRLKRMATSENSFEQVEMDRLRAFGELSERLKDLEEAYFSALQADGEVSGKEQQAAVEVLEGIAEFRWVADPQNEAPAAPRELPAAAVVVESKTPPANGKGKP